MLVHITCSSNSTWHTAVVPHTCSSTACDAVVLRFNARPHAGMCAEPRHCSVYTLACHRCVLASFNMCCLSWTGPAQTQLAVCIFQEYMWCLDLRSTASACCLLLRCSLICESGCSKVHMDSYSRASCSSCCAVLLLVSVLGGTAGSWISLTCRIQIDVIVGLDSLDAARMRAATRWPAVTYPQLGQD